MKIKFFPQNIEAGFSELKDGAMGFTLSYPAIDSSRRANRAEYLKWNYGLNLSQCVSPKLLHTNVALVVNEHNPIIESLQCDSLITNKKNLALTITGADCFPVYIYDPVDKVIALLHCGWKSLYSGLIQNTIATMKKEFNCWPENMLVYVGPGICKQCYEIGPDVAAMFGKDTDNCHINFSLAGEIKKQLIKAEVMEGKIQFSDECTFHTTENHEPKYFSARRERRDPLESQLAIMIMK